MSRVYTSSEQLIGKTPLLIWDLVNICTGLVTVPNIISMLLLSGVFFDIFNDFRKKTLSESSF